MSSTQYEQHGRVAVLRLDNPPVNGLGHEVRRGLVDAIRRAEADAAVGAQSTQRKMYLFFFSLRPLHPLRFIITA